MTSYTELFERCKKKDAKAQRMLYDLFKARLMGLSRRYSKDREEAQDILQESFVKIFKYIEQLETVDKLESWMKSIVVRTSIDHYHKTKNHNLIFTKEEKGENEGDAFEPLEGINDEYLISLINALPDGCRIVFNMFAVEGYSHAEISELLKISEGTSRSQLHHAKYLLKEKLKCQNMAHYYEKFA